MNNFTVHINIFIHHFNSHTTWFIAMQTRIWRKTIAFPWYCLYTHLTRFMTIEKRYVLFNRDARYHEITCRNVCNTWTLPQETRLNQRVFVLQIKGKCWMHEFAVVPKKIEISDHKLLYSECYSFRRGSMGGPSPHPAQIFLATMPARSRSPPLQKFWIHTWVLQRQFTSTPVDLQAVSYLQLHWTSVKWFYGYFRFSLLKNDVLVF